MNRQAMILIFIALGMREAWTLLPLSYDTFDPFPLYDIEITRPTYVYFLCHYLSMMVFAYAFIQLMREYQVILRAWFIIQTVELVDYLFTYNNPWFHVAGFGVGITVTKFVVFTVLLTRYLEWKK